MFFSKWRSGRAGAVDSSARRAVIESLEPRSLLSAPNLPFAASEIEHLVYVNQKGNATLGRKSIDKAGDVDAYAIRFDDFGTFSIETTGPTPTRLDFYWPDKPAKAGKVDANGHSKVKVWVPNKTMHYFTVRGLKANTTGRYAIKVRGLPYGVIRELNVKPETNSGGRFCEMETGEDIDFFQFKTTRRGTWSLLADPVPDDLDVTINMYDSKGRAVGGNFIRPINSAGPGEKEVWTASNLPAKATYFVRIDAKQGAGKYKLWVTGPAPRKTR